MYGRLALAGDAVSGAVHLAATALNAVILLDDILAIALNDAVDRAVSSAKAAADAVIVDDKHGNIPP